MQGTKNYRVLRGAWYYQLLCTLKFLKVHKVLISVWFCEVLREGVEYVEGILGGTVEGTAEGTVEGTVEGTAKGTVIGTLRVS